MESNRSKLIGCTKVSLGLDRTGHWLEVASLSANLGYTSVLGEEMVVGMTKFRYFVRRGIVFDASPWQV